MEKGLVKIYFGEGKGKSTSSMGRALVCASEEKEVFVIQFLKVLILDEILGLVDLGIITCEDVIRLIEMKDESVELIMTGRHLPDELIPYADYISRLDIVKGSCSEKPSCM